MRRRRFVAWAGGTFALSSIAFAQRPSKIYRIGFLGTAFASGYVREVEWIRAGLRNLGYEEGKNLVVEYRWAEGNPARVRVIAGEFTALKVDAIVVHGLPGAIAAVAASSSIPVVMADGADPVSAGLAKSLARPGGNVTGSTSFTTDEGPKRLQLMKEVVPDVKRVAFLASSLNPEIFGRNRGPLQAAAASMRLELQEFVVSEGTELPEAFNAMGNARMSAVVVNSEPLMNSHAGAIAGMATLKRLPSAGYASFADAGGLLAYGANRPALYGRTAYFLDRIFKGAKTGEIPIERAAKFDIIVNLKTARSLGIKVPQTVLARADRVIE